MNRNYVENCCLKAPGLAATGGATSTVSFANTFAVKANGIISADKTTAVIATLGGSKGAGNVAVTDLAISYSRIFTLLATVNATTGAITFSWVHGSDFLTARGARKTSDINFGNPENQDELKAVVGFVLIDNASVGVYVPGTTLLNVAAVNQQYIDAFGFVGM